MGDASGGYSISVVFDQYESLLKSCEEVEVVGQRQRHVPVYLQVLQDLDEVVIVFGVGLLNVKLSLV